FVHPEDQIATQKELEKLSTGTSTVYFENRYRCQDGSYKWLAWTTVPVIETQLLYAVAQDITERKQLEAELIKTNFELKQCLNRQTRQLQQANANLTEQEALYHTLAKHIPKSAVFLFDRDLRYLLCEGTELEAIGFKSEEIVGKTPREIFSTQTISEIEPIYRAALRGKFTFKEIPCQNKIYSCYTVPICNKQGEIFAGMMLTQNNTESKRSEAELAQKNSVLQAVIEGTNDVIFVKDLQGRYVIANKTACEWLGISVEQILGKNDTELFPSQVANHIIKMDKQVANTGESITYTEQVPKQGMLKTLHSIKYPWRSQQGNIVGVIGISRDITERQCFEKALQESELNFRTLADTVPQLVWTARSDGYADYFNRRWCEYTGMSMEQTQGWNWTHLLHPDDRQRCLDVWNESLRTGKKYNIEYRFRCASDGEYRWLLVKAYPLRNDSGEIIKWFGSSTDIDDQKKTEEALHLALQQAQVAQEEAETANRLKDEFLAVLSHELRTPLNPILGWTQIIQKPNVNEDKKAKGLKIIERNVKLQINLIEDLLDISRIMRGKLTLNTLEVNLKSVILAALDTVRLAAENKAIEIESNFTNFTLQVTGDAVRLQQVLWNLLSNAIKFTPNGGKVSVSLERVDAMAQITVSDTGKGINQEFLPYIFQYFRQEEASISRTFGGLGLGLAIVRNLVEMHGGTIEASSLGQGKGATFTVRLPLIGSNEVIEENQPQDVSKDLSGIKVLVVEDDADSLDFVTFDLQLHGAEVTGVSSASAALKVLGESKPDVLVSDIGMPKMDGYEMLRRIRASEPDNGSEILAIREASPLRAIALTAYAGEKEEQKAIEAGFQMYLSKPVEAGAVARAVAKLLSENSSN
ncbi:MAG: PAS domain S-box protein, partial [Cyanobacteria bacterium P01_D01_bin.50]